MKYLFLFSLTLGYMLYAAAQNAKGSSKQTFNQVRTANGVVEGVLEQSGVRSFKGVPFAAPPVGDLR